LTIKASQRVLDFFRAEASTRLFDRGPDPAALAVALAAQGVAPPDALWAFEERFGGWDGWTTLGVRASAERFFGRLPGHALIGHRGRNDFFMAPDGAVVTVEDEEVITVAGNAEAWLEQLALRHTVEVRQNAMDLRLRGAKTAALAAALGAKRDAPAGGRIECWVLPKAQGLLVGPYGDDAATLAVVPSVRAAARILSLKGQVDAVSITPIRPRDELLPAEDAPLRADVLGRVSFTPLRRGAFEHAVALSQQGEAYVLEQWSLPADGRARAHWHLIDGSARLTFFLGAPPSRRPAILSGIELAFDPRRSCASDEELKALLFARGFPTFPAALAFEKRFGGLSFWADEPVVLGVASVLRGAPWLKARDIGRGAPVALTGQRTWCIGASGAVGMLDEDDGAPPQSHPSAEAFVGFLAQRAQAWKRFSYLVEV
jgi:hypothetical protein